MSWHRLRAKYGQNKKSHQLLNAAMRDELPGAGLLLDALSHLSNPRPGQSPEQKHEMRLLLDAVSKAIDRVRESIMSRYGIVAEEPAEKPATPASKPPAVVRHFDGESPRADSPRGSGGGSASRDWSPSAAIVARMGKESDEQLARECGVSAHVVAVARQRLDIDPFADAGVWHWTPDMDRRLGTRDDGDLAKLWGMSDEAVRRRRLKLGIAATRAKAKWTPERLEILRSTPDNAQASAILGVSIASIKTARSRLKESS